MPDVQYHHEAGFVFLRLYIVPSILRRNLVTSGEQS